MKSFKPKKIKKEWGHEIWLANNEEENYCGKILYINGDWSTSMHCHRDKHETFYITQGDLRVETINTQTTETTEHIVKQGESFVVDRLVPHQLSPVNNEVEFIEISTFHRDEDSYRMWK